MFGHVLQFLSANLRYARKNLHYICYAVDAMNDYDIIPVASFQPALPERHKFYQLLSIDEEGGWRRRGYWRRIRID